MKYLFLLLVCLVFLLPAQAQPTATTYVLVHGAWGSSVVFKGVDSVLTHQGCRVYRPTLTGLGERRHLRNPSINLDTHIADIVGLIQTEDLHDVVLVGHSYAGMVISGVADQLPSRIKQLIYIDAFVANSGESVLTADNLSAASKASLLASVEGDYVNMPVASIKTLERQPLKTFTQSLNLTNRATQVPAVNYILMVPPNTDVKQADFYKAAQRARQRGWSVRQETGYHADLMSKPTYLAALLQQLLSAK